jgi:selenide,water dikinase
MKFGRAPAAAASAAIESMSRLNRAAADALSRLPAGTVHACTDVTGFGVIGHATEMAKGSGLTVAIDVDAVPLLAGALDLVEGHMSGGGKTNIQHFGSDVSTGSGLDARRVQLLYDPQTSGGLLAAVAPSNAAETLRALAESGVSAQAIGSVEIGQTVAVRLR